MKIYPLSLIEAIKDYMLQHGETISVAESVTSGHVQAALSLATDASLFFQGGITAYNVGQKSRHLKVDPITALGCDCVSESVTNKMAEEMCTFFSSNWGIAITGYASPSPQNKNELYAIYSVAYNGKIIQTMKIIPGIKEGNFEVQVDYVNQLLNGFVSLLNKKFN